MTMGYLLSQFWIFVVLAVALGLFVSWATRDADAEREGPGWLAPAGLLFAICLFFAAMKWLPGFWGLALEVGLMLFAAYILGCAIGCRLARRGGPFAEQAPAALGEAGAHDAHAHH